MKLPAPPPPLDEILAELTKDPEAFVALLTGNPLSAAMPEYLPWDKVRYQQPPNGLSHRQWWYLLKIARRLMQRPLPLTDADGRQFTYALPDTVLRLTEEINRRAGGQIALAEPVTNPSTRDRYIISSLIEEAITSSQLEGAVTSRQVAKDMIRSGRPPRNTSERMILNNYLAMRFVGSLRDQELTPALVCEIHRIVTVDTLDNAEQAGRLQNDPDPAARVAVYGDENQVIHRPPPVQALPGRLEALCRFANGKNDTAYLPPVLRALTLHFMMGYDHYFEDGNGRTARAVFYWSMLRAGYWLTEFLAISRILKKAPAQYARSFVLTEQDDGDLTYFFLHQLNVVRRALDDLDSYLTRKMRELRETRVLLATMPGEFNHRQLALLELALKDQHALFTIKSHSTSHNVSPETARQDLAALAERRLLDVRRVSRQLVWQPAERLAERIAAPPTPKR